jgi:CrcB protein
VVTPEARLFLMIGLLGGFTTFSTFGLETLALAQEAEGVRAAANVVLNLGAGLAAVWLGHLLGRIGMG